MPLATLNDVKVYLGLTSTTEDARLTMMLNGAMAAIINACKGWQFEQATFTEYYRPDGTILICKRRPVKSITSLYENNLAAWGQATDSFPSETLLTAGTEYALDKDGSGVNGEVSRSGLIHRIGRVWPRIAEPQQVYGTHSSTMLQRIVPDLGTVKMTYVAGYDTVPDDVVMAVYAEVDMMRQMRGKGGATIQSKSLGELSYSLANVDKSTHSFGLLQSPEAAALLANYMVGSLAI